MAEGGNRQAEVLTILAFAAGVAVGMNWPQIKKQVGPLMAGMSGKAAEAYGGVAKFFGEQRERAEDTLAGTKVRRVKRQSRRTVRAKG